MTMHNKDFIARMAVGRDLAKARRDEGGGTAHPSWSRKRGPDPATGTWERAVAEASAHWRNAAAEAIEDLRWKLYGDQWEGLS